MWKIIRFNAQNWTNGRGILATSTQKATGILLLFEIKINILLKFLTFLRHPQYTYTGTRMCYRLKIPTQNHAVEWEERQFSRITISSASRFQSRVSWLEMTNEDAFIFCFAFDPLFQEDEDNQMSKWNYKNAFGRHLGPVWSPHENLARELMWKRLSN